MTVETEKPHVEVVTESRAEANLQGWNSNERRGSNARRHRRKALGDQYQHDVHHGKLLPEEDSIHTSEIFNPSPKDPAYRTSKAGNAMCLHLLGPTLYALSTGRRRKGADFGPGPLLTTIALSMDKIFDWSAHWGAWPANSNQARLS